MKNRILIAGIMLTTAAGCSPQQYTQRGAVSTEPMIVDQAMQQRDWDPTHAYYQNGQTLNWSTGFRYVPTNGVEDYKYYYADTGTFFVNVLTLPFTFYDQRDGVISGGEVVPPSYTANPPLPPSDAAPPAPPTTEPAQ